MAGGAAGYDARLRVTAPARASSSRSDERPASTADAAMARPAGDARATRCSPSAIAALCLALAGALLAAGGGAPWLPGPPGAAASAEPAAPTPRPVDAGVGRAPSQRTSATPGAPPRRARRPSRPSRRPRPSAEAAATPTPARRPVHDEPLPEGVFVHQVDKDACVAAAAQNMLNVIRLVEEGREPDITAKTQRALYDRIVELTTWKDSHNGGTGPGGWAALLTEEGYPYEVRVYDSRLGRHAGRRLRPAGDAAPGRDPRLGRASTRG